MGNIKTYLMATLAAVFWGANFNLARPVLAEMSPYIAGASRYLLAAAIMVLVAQFRKEAVSLRHWQAYLTLGVVGVFGFNLFFFLGMETSSAINGALIMALNPLLTAVLGYVILGDMPTNRQLIAFPVGIAGVVIVVLGAGAQLKVSTGDIYILIATLNWALYNVLVKKMMPKHVSGITNTAGIMTAGALALTIAAAWHGDHFVLPTISGGAALLMMSLGGGVLAYLFWNASISHLGPSKAAIFMNLVPVTTMVIAAFEHMPPTHAQLFGALLVISAVTFSSVSLSKRS
ncbi:Threonine/homoserine efflux transporter RhtA [Methylophilus rhizosphaerae]|uniref:Threonine/homoserine efflux transporter RhtA n=1 Tax=Methylophilus rhizosphaerae TaxID=492660 RepID=A0A1G9BRD3_9PROT|nr:DMT family transporter [Methylophilus rhizosphaerae]SDK42006.1 Threonine/homoserine efflux transporter RhtA [Methylophilus rhizosphaerae]